MMRLNNIISRSLFFLCLLAGYDSVAQTNPVNAINTTSFDAYGILVKTGETEAIYFYREAVSAVPESSSGNGKIMARKYAYLTKSWGPKWLVYDDPAMDERNLSGGLNASGTQIILNFCLYKHDHPTSKYQYVKSIRSADLNGTGWSSPQTLIDNTTTKLYDAFSPSGHIVKCDNGNLVQPWYSRLGTTYSCRLMRSDDDGLSWNVNDAYMYNGPLFYGEPNVENIGNNTLIAMSRCNVPPYEAGAAFSTDGGHSWSATTGTNIASANGEILPYTSFNPATGKLFCVALDRGARKLGLYESSQWEFLEDRANCWHFQRTLDSVLDRPGYASIISFNQLENLVLYSRRRRDTDADTWTYMHTDDFPGAGVPSLLYDAFGMQVKTGEYESIYFYREGTEHVGTNYGKIMARRYNYLTNTWSAKWLVFDDPDLDDRNVTCGLSSAGDRIVLNFTQIDGTSLAFKNIRTLISADLTGAEGSWTLAPAEAFTYTGTQAAFSPHGHPINLQNGDLLQGWYIREGTNTGNLGPFVCKLMKSSDNGLTWDVNYAEIYRGDTFYFGEPFIEQIGPDTLVCIARNNNSDAGIYKVAVFKSFDSGLSWSPYELTNMTGKKGHILPYTYYDPEKELMLCAVLDRGGRKFNLYTATKQALLVNAATCWNLEGEIDTFKLNGYASTVKFADGNYFTVYARTNVENTISETKSFFWLDHYKFTGIKSIMRPVEDIPVVSAESQGRFTCFPNPVESWLYFELPAEDNLKKLTLRDFNGRKVFSAQSRDLSDNSIDCSKLKSGVYFLTIESALGKEEFKIIKR
ncbi:MAG: exo-alpha-sialidase [Bacteroidota bacterium]